jgi:hypothetical protein
VKNLFSRVYIEDVGDAPLVPGQIIKYEDYIK